jgi:hypothetical protein
MSNRLTILQNSLQKKEAEFDRRLTDHIATVKQANGQPLNDKRNGPATLRKWDRQNDTLRNIKEGIARTKKAIEYEQDRIEEVADNRSKLPNAILTRVENGTLNQWRKHPNTFFVPGVDKGRIVWNGKEIAHKYLRSVPEDQYKLFADTYNALRAALIAEQAHQQ